MNQIATKHIFNSTSHGLLQIISVNDNSEVIIQNVPDELAAEIPRALLLAFPDTRSVVTTINEKKWKRQQVGCNTDTHTHAEHTYWTQCHLGLCVLFLG